MENAPVITDNYGRIHNYLRISLTEKCNLRCFYCMPEEGLQLRNSSYFMNKEEVVGIAKVFTGLGVTKIRVTGGEPLVCRDASTIIKGLSALPVELAITSNGILTDRFIPVFKEANLSNVNISLDTLNKDKHFRITRRDYFDKTIQNIALLVEKGFKIKINVVLIKGVNDDEISDFVHFTKDKSISIRFIEYMPFFGNDWDPGKVIGKEKILNRLRLTFGKNLIKIPDSLHDTSSNYKIAGFKGTFAIISSVTNPFCSSCNRLRLTADGKLKNCLFSNTETDLLTPFRMGEKIDNLIMQSVWDKQMKWGGMNELTAFTISEKNQTNRTMAAIGG